MSGYPWEENEKTGLLALDPLHSPQPCANLGVGDRISLFAASTPQGTRKGKLKLRTMNADVEKHKHEIPRSYENTARSTHSPWHLQCFARLYYSH